MSSGLPGCEPVLYAALMPFRPTDRLAPTRRGPPRHGLARVISKRGICSRSQAERWVREGRVRVDGRVVRDPQAPTTAAADIRIDDSVAATQEAVYVMVNKPRGIVVSAADEKGRDTVYGLLEDSGLPWMGPVGRLDRASEGLLLLSNDTDWSARLLDPATHMPKTYHVQVRGVPGEPVLAAMRAGVEDRGEQLRVVDVALLRSGGRNAWLEVVLDEGRNRHIRRLLAALGFEVQRLVRVAIGPLRLGDLPKGGWRHLAADERLSLGAGSGARA